MHSNRIACWLWITSSACFIPPLAGSHLHLRACIRERRTPCQSGKYRPLSASPLPDQKSHVDGNACCTAIVVWWCEGAAPEVRWPGSGGMIVGFFQVDRASKTNRGIEGTQQPDADTPAHDQSTAEPDARRDIKVTMRQGTVMDGGRDSNMSLRATVRRA